MFIDVIGSVSVSARQHRHNGATTRYELKIKYGNGGSITALEAHSHAANRIHRVTLQFGFLLCCLAPSSRTVSCGLHNCNIIDEPTRTTTK